MEQYHVVQAHPQLVIPGCVPHEPGTFDPRPFVDAELQYLRTMSEGMAGMVHANDVRIAEGLRDIELPADPARAMATWNRALNDAVVRWHRDARPRRPRPQRARGARDQRAHGLLLPALLRAADVQQRLVLPVPAARAGGDADGDLVAHSSETHRTRDRAALSAGRRRHGAAEADSPCAVRTDHVRPDAEAAGRGPGLFDVSCLSV